MVWALMTSLVINILLLIAILLLVVNILDIKTSIEHYHDQWQKWEGMWYETQQLVYTTYKVHISPSGLRSKVEIKKENGDE